MSAAKLSVSKIQLRTQIGIYLFLYLLYLAYRVFYWQSNLPEQWGQVILNATFDLCLVFGLQWLFRKIAMERRLNRILMFCTWVVLAIGGTFLLRYLHYYGHLWTWGFDESFRKTFNLITFQVFDAFIVVMVGFSLVTAFHLLVNWNAARIQIAELEKDKAIAEINYLRSQINPHFVFNTLNSIFFLIQADNDPARDALHTFSGMLRYQLYESNKELVPIEDEIHYLENYVYLQKLRQEEETKIEFIVTDSVSEFSLAPMLLIVPIENAFKHISHNTTTSNQVSIKLDRRENEFTCEVFNTCAAGGNEEYGGIGLGNLNRRLELLYPEQSSITIKETDSSYLLKLTLTL